MLIYATLIAALIGLAAWPLVQPVPPTIDHSGSLRQPDGSWKYTNRLADSSSPYLLQHAHNPVDWYQWGEEAFKASREQNKPIFLSVGYSTCYWCHVMEREVFENPEIAALMNQLFICIKVDREQRPDIDEIYMMATQLMTQQGGWPNSIFLTPGLKPFYAGTYFGPTDQPGRPGFPTLIQALDDAWKNRRADVLAASNQSAAAIAQALNQRAAPVSRASLGTGVSDLAVSQLAQRYDARLGGFGAAPKFPQDFYYEFLFDVYRRTGEQPTLDMALHSLRMMAAGGIYDHVGGGFHRYSTDSQWRVPHFEKMLYNHAQLARAYVAAWQTTRDEAFADVARGIFRHVAEVMTGPDGQFYSALDAETDAVEGAYYVWTHAEVDELLNDEQMALFNQVFALGDVPTFPGHKHPEGGVLYMRKPIVELADDLKLTPTDLREALNPILSVLNAKRDGRERPRLDDKVIAGWNGMMIGAYALAGAAFEDTALLDSARRAADFVLNHMRSPDGRLMRLWRQGVVQQPAFQEDYAFFIQGLLALHDATGEAKWLAHAVELAKGADQLFWNEIGGGYYFAQQTPDLIARSKSTYDGAIPSGNSAMLHNLVTLWQKTRNEIWRDRYEGMLEAFGGVMTASPVGHIHMVHALERWEQFAPIDQPGKDPSTPGIEIPRVPAGETKITPMDSSEHVKAVLTIEPPEVAPGATFTIRVGLDIAKGWHINANAVSSPLLIPTVVDLRGANPIEVLTVTYPEATELTTDYTPQPIRVFEGAKEVVITARLAESASAGAKITLPIFMQFQACDDRRCLPPAQVVQEVALTIAR